MKVLFDQGVPAPLRSRLAQCVIETADDLGWGAMTNGALLDRAEANGFGVMVTTDKNLRHQQNLSGRRIAVVVLSTTSWPRIREQVDPIAAAIASALPGSLQTVEVG